MGLTWLSTLDHKRIGVVYMLLGIWGGYVGLSFSFLIRVNYLHPWSSVVRLDVYNTVVTTHGVAMIFFFLMPVLIGGFGNYLMPFLLSFRDLCLPRINGLSAWLLIPSAISFGLSMIGQSGVGWTLYPPLSSGDYSGWGVDFLLFSLHMAGVSSLLSSLNFAVTILSAMHWGTYNRYSILVWSYLFTSALLLFSLPVLASGITMLLFDRNFSTAFFDPLGGGDPVMFQHMFWFFGHPEVYVLILPGFGMVSHVCMTYSGNDSLFGYSGLVFAMFAIVCLGSVVWAHHMFVVGLDVSTSVFFSSVTMIIGVPTGIKIFSWMFMLNGVEEDHHSDPIFVWIVAFVILFVLGGITGVMLSSSVVDSLLHDTWFVVAHFHYVLSLGSFSTLVIFLVWWWPVVMGLAFNSSLLFGHWAVSMLGFNLCFFPMHIFGFYGMPRRVCIYESSFQWLNTVSSIGSFISVVSAFALIYILWESLAAFRRVLGIWGVSTVVLSSLVVPVPHHGNYLSDAGMWRPNWSC